MGAFFWIVGGLRLWAGSVARAEDVDLFTVHKPVHVRNVLEVQAREENGCVVKDLDFLWHMAVDEKGKPAYTKRSQAESLIRRRFEVKAVDPANAASCPKDFPGKTCSAIAIAAAEMGWVHHGLRDPSLVVRGQAGEDGGCKVGAYLDLGPRVLEVKDLKVIADKVEIRKFLGVPTGARFRVIALEVRPKDGGKTVTFPCTEDCEKSEP